MRKFRQCEKAVGLYLLYVVSRHSLRGRFDIQVKGESHWVSVASNSAIGLQAWCQALDMATGSDQAKPRVVADTTCTDWLAQDCCTRLEGGCGISSRTRGRTFSSEDGANSVEENVAEKGTGGHRNQVDAWQNDVRGVRVSRVSSVECRVSSCIVVEEKSVRGHHDTKTSDFKVQPRA